METATQINSLTDAIKNASTEQVDASWAILKYKEIGIYRKVACLAKLYNINLEELLGQLPQDDEGRILDYKTRYIVHDALLSIS